MNQIEVQIMGRAYILVCPEDGGARLKEAVRRVDQAMCQIRDAGKVRTRDRIAVLAAVNLAFELADPARARATPEAPTATADEAGDLTALLDRLDDTLASD